ncbi:SH3 domain-containing protein [Arcobacter sp. FWKO B]|uniref:C40 family peptidase n=1 Tax=Arcobacter sp. FWKO B TaxID=2593672 RepID=UPI0018A4E59D|nr:SH3 domain-containing C40 family peptidase [Arcobacter sp. FWKO B]QOG11561.1 hypothetical protein FWKOB_02100 [Arcobacter sp. FWKO B]
MNIKYLFVVILSLFLVSCSTKDIAISEVKDITTIEQKPYAYIDNFDLLDEDKQVDHYDNFLAKYFNPWNINELSFSYEQATWGLKYTTQEVYGENHRLISKEWFEKIVNNSNYEKLNSLSKRAITVNYSHIRVFPTNSVIFHNPKKAGEGFPFDYNENSSIKPNVPLFVSHISLDKRWAFVESSFVLGWIDIKDIAFVDDEFIDSFKTGEYYVSVSDNLNIYKDGILIDDIELGTIFPKVDDKLLLAFRNINHSAYIGFIDDNDYIKQMPIKFDYENIKNISDELIGQRYGWGGLYGHRDCSLMIRDFYTPFGIFLSRNSGDQRNDGVVFDLSNLDDNGKKEFIKNNGIPFLTIVYLRGHTMMYVGTLDGEPLVFHNMWGIRTKQKDGSSGRFIVGQSVVSTLDIGSELPNFDSDNSMLSRILSITLLAQ